LQSDPEYHQTRRIKGRDREFAPHVCKVVLRNKANSGHLCCPADVVGAAIMAARIASGEIGNAKGQFYLDCFDR
jgi:hypothetical protein